MVIFGSGLSRGNLCWWQITTLIRKHTSDQIDTHLLCWPMEVICPQDYIPLVHLLIKMTTHCGWGAKLLLSSDEQEQIFHSNIGGR